MKGDPPFRIWRPVGVGYEGRSGGWVPAFNISQAPNHAHMVVNADDVGRRMSLIDCRRECEARNTAQLKAARETIADLEKELEGRKALLKAAQAACICAEDAEA